MTHQHPVQLGEQGPPYLQEEPNISQQLDEDAVVHVDVAGISGSGICQYDYNDHHVNDEGNSFEVNGSSTVEAQAVNGVDDNVTKEEMKGEDQLDIEDNGRERLKRHRIEVAGRVWIPEMWGEEEFLKDWIDCSAFDAALFPTGILSARAALVEEGRRANSGRFRIENRC